MNLVPSNKSQRWLRYFEIPRARIFGAPLYVHSGIVFSLVFFMAIAVADAVIAVEYFLVFVGSVLLHEYGHAFVADRLGLKVFAVHVSWLHGLCEYEHPPNEWEDVLVAWGGVLAQFAVAFVAWALLIANLITETSLLGSAVSFLVSINIIIAVINLLPVERYDGKLAWRVIPLFRDQIRAHRVAKDAIDKLKK